MENYMIRKPNPMIFQLALRKANLCPNEVWFCGDNIRCDVQGAHGAGIFPVRYHRLFPNESKDKFFDGKPECEHLYIKDWLELVEVLEEIK